MNEHSYIITNKFPLSILFEKILKKIFQSQLVFLITLFIKKSSVLHIQSVDIYPRGVYNVLKRYIYSIIKEEKYERKEMLPRTQNKRT